MQRGPPRQSVARIRGCADVMLAKLIHAERPEELARGLRWHVDVDPVEV